MPRVRVLIADDHGVVRAGLRALLDSQPDMQVCGEAANGAEAVDKAAETVPDIVLLDLKMPGLGGLEAISRIKAAQPAAKVLVLTMYDDASYLRSALNAGASGYVLKRAIDVELLTAIRSVYEGGVHVDPTLTRTIVEGFLGAPRRSTEGEHEEALSDREREVLKLLAYGHTNQEIAERLFLSVKTVEGYKARLVEKLGIRGRAALTRYAIDKGLLSDEP